MVQAITKSSTATLYGIASRTQSTASDWIGRQRYSHNLDDQDANHIKIFHGYQSILDDPNIDWIYNALPPSLHCSLTVDALRAGKNVLCEKPFAVDARQAIEMAAVAHQTGRRLLHATSFPFHPRSHAARRIVLGDIVNCEDKYHCDPCGKKSSSQTELGEIKRVTVACTFSGAFDRGDDHRCDVAQGGGCLLDLGWYCALSTRWFTGLAVKDIRSIGVKRKGVWSSLQAIVILENGAIAHWDCGFDVATRRWIEIAGDNGSWICDDFLRPWDLSKPRFWVHGKTGNVRCELHGEGTLQESLMIDACNVEPEIGPVRSDEWYNNQLSAAVETQRVLDLWSTNCEAID